MMKISEDTSGNGALMRMAPEIIIVAKDLDEARRLAVQQT